MAVSREEMLMQSIATGSPSNVVPITREEQYLAYIAGETYTKPDEPITRKEVFLDKIPQGGSSGGGGVTIRNQNKTITENGTYTADSGYTGLGTVTVEVASGGGGDMDALIEGALKEVNSGATKIDAYKFYRYGSLRGVSFPNAKSIGEGAFSNCTALNSFDFPNVTSIGRDAFNYCSALRDVIFPKATSIDMGAFQNCSKLASGIFPSVTSVSTYAFSSSPKLESVDFSKPLEIGSSSFSSCSSLKAVILRSETLRCTLKATSAFSNCYHIHGTVNSTYNPNGDKDGYIYVPRALVDSYKSATNWSTYSTQFRALEDYTVDGTTTGALDPNKI